MNRNNSSVFVLLTAYMLLGFILDLIAIFVPLSVIILLALLMFSLTKIPDESKLICTNDRISTSANVQSELILNYMPKEKSFWNWIYIGNKRYCAVSSKQKLSRISILLPKHNRGEHNLGKLRLQKSDPWGWFNSSVFEHTEIQLCVFPEIRKLSQSIEYQIMNLVSLQTEIAQGFEEVVGLRDYVLGDSKRDIDWASSSRTGKLQVRHYHGLTTTSIDIFLETNSDLYNDVIIKSGRKFSPIFEKSIVTIASIVSCAALSSRNFNIYTSHGETIVNGSYQDSLLFLTKISLEGLNRLKALPRHFSIVVSPMKESSNVSGNIYLDPYDESLYDV